MRRLQAGWQERRGRWWWLAVLILVPVVLGSTLSVALLLTLVDTATAADQIELIKTGLAVGAGAGGAVALVLAGRRQWSTEQAHRVTEHDAAERRITDLYSKAADQLGSDKAAVRLAGLYSLERLGQNTPALRQTIVNVLCAYLRMPVDLPAESEHKEIPDDIRQELEVRQTAQRILATHVDPGAQFWADMVFDLRGATLYLFDMNGAWIAQGLFGGARFIGWTRFDECRFGGFANFGGALFDESASFRSTWFQGEARFRGATFNGPARFDNAIFEDDALFGGTRHMDIGDVDDGATFSDDAVFTGAKFAKPPVLDYVRTNRPLVDVPNPNGSVELD